jgi:hypothetical protein
MERSRLLFGALPRRLLDARLELHGIISCTESAMFEPGRLGTH